MKKIAWFALIVLFLGAAGTLISIQVTDALGNGKEKVHKEESFPGDQVQDINIETAFTNVHLINGENRQVQVELAGQTTAWKKHDFEVNLKGGELSIELDKRKNWLGFSFGLFAKDSLDLFVTVPDQAFQTLTLQTSSADVKLDGIASSVASVKTSSGNILMENQQINEELDIRSSSGDVTLRHLKGVGRTEIHTSSGEVSGEDLSLGHTEAKTSSGDVNLTYSELAGDFFADTSSGEVDLSFEETPSSFIIDYSSSSGDERIDMDGIDYERRAEHEVMGQKGEGKYQIQVKTSSGDFHLE
ncbi:DUF4097 family beta strand repeat-containing protein [Sediminibacillus massiliensis]|uniref:DUF4097 family beta strand repeat-containing protein n=1 Tax=Sediminibacillus massiliensis TaxID=1926277 RepID=UPI00098856C4|nr:DUF4097 family beta strand repeat-containing protein [Sediminibacillus massiliensis]